MSRYEVELTDDQARALADRFPGERHKWYDLWYDLSDQACWELADAIRANPPKPHRMDEPGWGEKVIATDPHDRPRVTFLRTTYAGWENDRGQSYGWDELVDPEPWDAS